MCLVQSNSFVPGVLCHLSFILVVLGIFMATNKFRLVLFGICVREKGYYTNAIVPPSCYMKNIRLMLGNRAINKDTVCII